MAALLRAIFYAYLWAIDTSIFYQLLKLVTPYCSTLPIKNNYYGT